MRIGIILHGPEAVDDGSAERIINTFKIDHHVTAKLGGTMGRTAVLDAGLDDVIDITLGMTPSKTIDSLMGKIDIIILISRGKSLDTGRHFGRIVASRIDLSIPFIHIESPFYGGKIIYYGKNGERCAEYVRGLLKKHIPDLELPIESGIPLCPHFMTEGDKQIRRIYGALPGENIRVEGVVIGHITNGETEIICRDGKVVEVRGIKIKPHGLAKLDNKKIDLLKAEVKTGNIRRTKHATKIKPTRPLADGKKIVIIDHCAESTFELVGDADIAITVGDDTTTIAADILTRLGIAIIGITDGDPDCILGEAAVPAGSIIIRVKEGYDDIIGREISEKLMLGKQKLAVRSCEEIVEKVLNVAGKKIVEIKHY